MSSKLTLPAPKYLSYFGVDDYYVNLAAKVGMVLRKSADISIGYEVVVGDTVLGIIPIKGITLSLVKQNKLSQSSKSVIKGQFEAIFEKALASKDLAPQQSPPEPVEWDDFDEAEEPSVSDDNLALYESVCGTSPGSIYQVIALFKGMNLAARVKGKKLSLRAFGPELSKYAVALESVGLSSKGGKHYSNHVHISCIEDGTKYLGAIVAMAGFDNLNLVGDLKNVGGK